MHEFIELNSRLHQQITDYCETNNLNLQEYLVKLIEDGFYTDKYGDLNAIRNEVLEVEIPNENVIESCRFESPDIVKVKLSNVKEEISIRCGDIPLYNPEIYPYNEIAKQEVKTEVKEGGKKVIVKRKIQSK